MGRQTAKGNLLSDGAWSYTYNQANRLVSAKTVWIVAALPIMVWGIGSGKPFNEPIFSYSPFVMDSEEEIRWAIHELRNGR